MTSITESKMVPSRVTVATECDVCKARVDGGAPDEWHHLSQRHNDWGNDSGESYESFDVCSPECYVEQIRRSIADLGSSRTGVIDEMSIQFAQRFIASLGALT